MADKGIIFSAPMVRALLDGRKTQTRRLLNSVRVFRTHESAAYTLKGEHLQRALQNADGIRRIEGTGWTWQADAYEWQAPAERTWWLAHIAYAPGDCLYVREAWSVRGEFSDVVEVGYRASENHGHTEYVEQWPVATAVPGKAKPGRPAPKWPEWPKYGPSIHMPRWASRMWLAVTDVRVQRLQECSEADAKAEGLGEDENDFEGMDPRLWYRDLWNSLHTAEGDRWEDNPWVVAITFEVHQGNIDAGGRAALRPDPRGER